MFYSKESLISIFFLFQLRIFYFFLRFIDYLPMVLFLFILFFYVADSSIAFSMEQDCRYVLNNNGDIQVHPKTGEPLQDCRTTKSDYVVAMETIKSVVEKINTADEKIVSEPTPSVEGCKSCK